MSESETGRRPEAGSSPEGNAAAGNAAAGNDAASVGERLTGESDPRDPDGLLAVDQIAGGSHGAKPEDGLQVPRGDRIEQPTADPED